MILTIADILRPEHLILDMGRLSQGEAILKVATLLRGDPRVTRWEELYAGLTSRTPCLAGGMEFEICIPHARTASVKTMVMAVGRSREGVQLAGATAKRVNFVFVIGVPQAMASDYLRIIGALARIFRDPATESRLRETPSPQDFIRILTGAEFS